MAAKKYHHGDLKNALVEAGLVILERDGLPGLSLRAIAAEVGVSHTAPKNHFGSLKGLLTAIAAEGFRRHAAFMRAGVAETSSRKARLHAAMDGYVRFAQAHPHLFELMFSSLHCDFDDPDLGQSASASYAMLSEISEGLDWDKADAPNGQLRTEAMLWSLVHGYAKLYLSGQIAANAQGAVPSIADIMPDFSYRDA